MQADLLSRICDPDDWGLSWDTFRKIDLLWGPHSIDHFANYINLKIARFNLDFGVPVQKVSMHLPWLERSK